ncbi:MAG TPA: MerR family transcriptional regulator [Bacteroidales bacterium]|jgi:DNA-binding transcriptional MerR regulator|nr:MerR family transcriptional regulator [Bacteroidales bacterium]MDI9574628.1 MerR family transcriptional regulator [Bacteroidota bacterium]OQC61629.1 MAG: HTH-type transcriptional regulator ZntR [Bacteroidetes bacterium ADurb.Bin012]MBP9512156.1 MerR family transcriptional regulator [Bacteroidales bacterium]MBP9587500.1 MerR family transcriptional regulator [Bacteroidales bacterium]
MTSQNNQKKKQHLYYTIGEVSRMLDVNPSTLRYWEKEFDGIHPYRNRKGTRFYHTEDVETLRLIKYLLKERGFTIAGARDYLKTSRSHVLRNMDIVETLKNIREFLIQLRNNL